jgi:crossover junction endodeoxyribonuclease RuvC
VTWKRAMQVPSDKGACRMRAMQTFPGHSDLFRRVKDDGRAEAALLGFYGATAARKPIDVFPISDEAR